MSAEIKTTEIKLTDEELKLFFTIKKKELSYKEVANFLDLFCFFIEKDFFQCKGGKKTAFFDGDGKLRRIISEKIDWAGPGGD